MTSLNLNNAVNSDMTNNLTEFAVDPKGTDGIGASDETTYVNTSFSQQWAYFNEHPEYKSAITMRTVWDCGKGYTADPETTVILDHITGMGKDTFDDVLFNADLMRYAARDSFCEIIRDEETGTLINLKPLDPSSIRIVFDGKGIIKRYEQISKLGDKKVNVVAKFKPEEIFHLSFNRFGDQIHGIAACESLDSTLKADLESFKNLNDVGRKQAKPFILWKLKTDDAVKIAAFVSKVENARNLGEDLFIPDDESIATYEIVQMPANNFIFQQRQEITNRLYRSLGMPLILFGSTNGTTESGGKMEYYAHEQVWEHSQSYLEKQIWNQLNLRINLIAPQSMKDELMTDQNKDAQQGLDIAPADTQAGVGA